MTIAIDHEPLLQTIHLAERHGPGVRVTLHRTLRLPDDGHEHPLPPSLGRMAVHRTAELSAGVRDLVGDAELVVAMHRHEALWVGFDAPDWRPAALRVGAGRTCALTGEDLADESGAVQPPSAHPQSYLVTPEQPWLDGIVVGEDRIRQFVVVERGAGHAVEGQLGDRSEEGGLRLALFASRPGRFPRRGPRPSGLPDDRYALKTYAAQDVCSAASLGLGAGGAMRQEVYADEHGVATWEREPCADLRVAMVEAHAFAAATGLPVPPSPITAATYAEHGLPWFDYRRPGRERIDGTDALRGVESVSAKQGVDVAGLGAGPGSVVPLGPDPD